MNPIALVLLTCWSAATAQETFRTTVPEVLIPVTLLGRDRRFVSGLGPGDFTVLDNGKPKTPRVEAMDSSNVRVALVVAVQANDISAPALLKIRKTGSMIQPMLAGEGGRAAVLGFGHRVETIEKFTASGDQIAEAFATIQPQRPITADFANFDARRARMLDAVVEGAHLLAKRPSSERRILLVVSETRDRGSESKIEDALAAVQRAGVTVYHASYSAYRTAFTTRAGDSPAQPGGPNYIGGISEAIRRGKTNDAEILTRQSGGDRLTFATLKALEGIVARFGEEIHSQYLLTCPAETSPPGYRTIEVRVNRPNVAIRSRPGYWVTGSGTEPAPPRQF